MIGILALSVGVSMAQSVSESYVIGVRPKIYVSIGTTSGISMSKDTGLYVGGMAGVSRVKGNHLLGVSTEVFYDSSLAGVTGTIGPKVGVLIGEMDLGFAMNTGLGTPSLGGYMRTGLNFGLVSSYYRIVLLSEDSIVHHIGLTLKFPQQLGYRPRIEY